MNYTSYYDACAYLESLGKLGSPLEYMRERKPEDLGKYLVRMQDLLDRIGNPERGFKYIHVTGTAGKGTTTALLHTMLTEAGYTVGSTTSPATTTTLERIKVGEYYIEPEVFAELVDELKPVINDMYSNGEYGKPSYFDIILAIALLYFKKMNCEWVVLEVGMGGRYDSTNIISQPVVTVITNIGFDHMHLLGNTLESIAREKAGIIKQGSAFFTTERESSIQRYFKEVCDEIGADYHQVTADHHPNQELVSAIGIHLGIAREHIASAITKTQLPCRFEVMDAQPLIILDGAHNPSKVAFSLKKLTEISYEKLHVVFGAGEHKDAIAMIDLIAPFADTVHLCPVTNGMSDSFSVEQLHQHVQNTYPDLNVSVYVDPSTALDQTSLLATESDAVLVIGSLYLAGALRERWYSVEYIVQNRQSF